MRNITRRHADCLLTRYHVTRRDARVVPQIHIAIDILTRPTTGGLPTAPFINVHLFLRRSLNFDITRHIPVSVPEIIEGVRRGGGSPLRPVIDEASVEEEVSAGREKANVLKCFEYNLHVNACTFDKVYTRFVRL